MRKRHLVLALIALLVSASAIAQTLSGLEANKKIAGASLIKTKTGGTAPSFIKLNGQTTIQATSFDQWIISSLELEKGNSFKAVRKSKDKLGFTHYTYQHRYNNYPVEGAVYKVHAKDGKIESVNGNVEILSNVSTTQVLSENDALQAALKNIKAQQYKWENPDEEKYLQLEQNNPSATYYPTGELVLVQSGKSNNYVLAYKFDVYASLPLQRYYIFVNAANGQVVRKINRIHASCFGHNHHHHPDDISGNTSTQVNAAGSAVTLYSGTQSITTDDTGSGFRLRETGRGDGVETYNMNNSEEHLDAVDFTDADNIWNTEADKAAYDAHWGAEVTYDYYESVHGRSSFDDNGAKMLSYVHFGTDFDNAFWDGSRMTYGDGSNAPGGFKALTALDVVGHEFTHGVTEFSANLIYAGESGALNESFSDMFGIVIEHVGKPASANFLLGDQVMFSGGALRSMSNPNAFGQPDTYKGTFWDPSEEVHTNSGVGNFWFYLLCQGGSGTNDNEESYAVTSIGMTKAAAIAYRTLTVYLTENSSYEDAREASILAAIDLYGDCGAEVQAVTNAWQAVGVGATFTTAVKASFKSTYPSFCAAPATINFTNLSSNAVSYSWNFGDGNNSTDENPVHTYTANGTYTVSLAIVGGGCGNGNDDTTIVNLVSVNPANPCPVLIPVSGGGATQTSCTGLLMDDGGYGEYSNDATGFVVIAPTNAERVTLTFSDYDFENFFDGVTIYDGPSTSSPVIGVFPGSNNPGTIVSTGGAITVAQTSNASTVKNGFLANWTCTYPTVVPSAKFHAGPVYSCDGDVTFIDKSTHAPSSWTWNFGDGGTSTLQNPTHQYATSGVYTISLTACNVIGCSTSEVKTGYITVNKETGVCDEVTMPADEDILITSCKGTLYDSGGENDYPSMSSSLVTIKPTGVMNVTLSFTSFSVENQADYVIVYDGETIDDPILGVFTGNKIPDVITSSGNAISIEFSSDFIVEESGFVCHWNCNPYVQVPTANFIGTPLSSCDGEVAFADQSSNVPTSWLWNFGDGNMSTLKNPEHTYGSNGIYTVRLKACNPIGCSSTTIKTDYINVAINPSCAVDVMPTTTSSSNVITDCSGTLYDTGGKGDYSDNVLGSVTIAPTDADNVALSFASFSMEYDYDFLSIYDGVNANAPLIGKYTGNTLPNSGLITSSGGAITLVQSTDISVTMPGFVLNWSCIVNSTRNESLQDVAVQIFPNPANKNVNIKYAFSGSKNLNITMYNILGAAVYSDAGIFVDQYQQELNVADFAKGLYTIRVVDENGRVNNSKLVIE